MELQICNETNAADKSFVIDNMIEFNLKHFPDQLKGRYQVVNLVLKDVDGNRYGGLVGEICWNWLEVQYLFVDEACRKWGYGTKLLLEAEKLAREKRCDFIKLDTLSFQAIDFYKKHGFEVFGTIHNAGGHTHYYLKKELGQDRGENEGPVWIIQSDKLNLRKTEVIDLAFVLDTENDVENRAFVGQWTLDQHREALTDEDILHFVIENKQGEKVGYIILSGLLDPNKAVCIKRITNKNKGNGYGKEAMKMIVKWLFECTETHRIWLDVKDFNRRARHVYVSVGFIYEGTLRDSFFNGNGFESLVVMSMLRHEYEG